MRIDVKQTLVDPRTGEPIPRVDKLPVECPKCQHRFFGDGDPPEPEDWTLGELFCDAIFLPPLEGDRGKVDAKTDCLLVMTVSQSMKNGDALCDLDLKEVTKIADAIEKNAGTRIPKVLAGQALLLIEELKSAEKDEEGA